MAESTTYRLAKHDKERYPNIITANEYGTPYYTNSSHLPVNYTEDVFEALDIQDQLQTLYTSGTVFHAFLGEKLPSWQSTATIVRKIAENYRLPYYTMSPTYSVCSVHGYISGEHFTCPTCGGPAEVYSRITGYYRPVQNWNEGKSQEYKDRKEYALDTINSIPHTPILFASHACPNCKVIATLLDKIGFVYEKVFAEDDRALVDQYEVRTAPTLVVWKDDKPFKLVGIKDIRPFIDQLKN